MTDISRSSPQSSLPLGCGASPSHMTSHPEVSRSIEVRTYVLCICMRVILPLLQSIESGAESGSSSNASAINCIPVLLTSVAWWLAVPLLQKWKSRICVVAMYVIDVLCKEKRRRFREFLLLCWVWKQKLLQCLNTERKV